HTTAAQTRDRLKAAVHYTVGRLCQKVGEKQRREFSRQVVAAIAETTFRQCEIFAKDLEAFARHAKRSTVSTEDVKLAARRSTALVSLSDLVKITCLFYRSSIQNKYTFYSRRHTWCLICFYFSPSTYKIKVKNWPRRRS
uniref:Centromere protein S n=1 Tax=Kryptolebias marmoratus TaxID=37003 RepID=A0A3Q3AA77_KRYMA